MIHKEEFENRPSAERSQRIAVLTVYFGQLPPYIHAHLRSIEANSTIDWIFISDSPLPFCPPNVQSIHLEWSDFVSRLEEFFTFEISLADPYKICDFRPAFGEIFADLLEKYEFWGHADIDVIFGDLGKFVTASVLDAHDKIMIRGNFALYRNIPAINGLYRSRPDLVDYREVFSKPGAFQFDEWKGVFPLVRAAGVSLFNPDLIFDLSPVSYRTRANSAERGFHAYLFRDGAVYEADYRTLAIAREGMLIHFQQRPMNVPDGLDLTSFVIGPSSLMSDEAWISDQRSPFFSVTSALRGARWRWRRLAKRARRARSKVRGRLLSLGQRR